MKKQLAALAGLGVMGATALAAPPALATTQEQIAAASRLTPPTVGPEFAVVCKKKSELADTEPTFHAVLPDATTPSSGVSIEFRLSKVTSGQPRRVVATGTADTFGSGVANWTPDYAAIGDLTDGTWTIAAREVLTPSDGSRVQTSRWSGAQRFQVDTEIPESPTVTLNPDGSLSLAAKGAAGFVWSFGGSIPSFGAGQEICVTSGDENGGTIVANHRGAARLVTGMTGPMFFTVAAYGPSGQLSAVSTQVIGFPG